MRQPSTAVHGLADGWGAGFSRLLYARLKDGAVIIEAA